MEDQTVQNPISEPTPTPVQVSEPKTKFSAIHLVLSLFVLVLLASTVFLYYQNMQLKNLLASYKNSAPPTPTTYQSPAPTTDLTANWKTYADVTHIFSLKYPSDWIISNGNYLNGEKYINLGTECLNIKISTYSTTNTLEEFIQQQGNTTENVSEMKGPKSDQFTSILDKNMIESFSLGQHGSGQIDNIYLKNKQTVLYLRLSEFDIQELPTDQRQNHVCNFDKTSIFNQILSTFKFTN